MSVRELAPVDAQALMRRVVVVRQWLGGWYKHLTGTARCRTVTLGRDRMHERRRWGRRAQDRLYGIMGSMPRVLLLTSVRGGSPKPSLVPSHLVAR